MNTRTKFLLDAGLLEVPDPRITLDPIRPSSNFLAKFSLNYCRTGNVDAAIRRSYMQLLKTETNNDEDIQIIKESSKQLFKISHIY